MNEEMYEFEQGPIRPPNEARSLLLRITRNCTWNKCLFCPVYKSLKFSRRTVAEIKKDIECAKHFANTIKTLSVHRGYKGEVDRQFLQEIFADPGVNNCYKSVALWLYYGTGACFLQDADNLVMKTDDLVTILTFLLEQFPQITRVTTYSRSRTILGKSLEDLTRIRQAGLNRVHIGLETGYDPLLTFMKKGVTAAQHIEAGTRVRAAGMEVSEYVMPGLGGQEMWQEHAIHSAQVLNQINPHFIRLRSLRIPGNIPLSEKIANGTFTLQSEDQVIQELKLFIETLKGIESTIASDHSMNLLEGVAGKLPEDKPAMLAEINRYLDLSPKDRLIFRFARRSGYYRSVEELDPDTDLYRKIANIIEEIELQQGSGSIESVIAEIADRFI